MRTRIGFVGVGKWARQLRDAFVAEGAAVRAYSRKNSEHGLRAQGFDRYTDDGVSYGHRSIPWRDLVASEDVDLVVAAADPETTTAVALECARTCKPVVATKPLFDHPPFVAAPFYVDFWRQWCPAYRMLSRRAVETRKINVSFYGKGPFREGAGGLDDYYPHVSAFLNDFGFGSFEIESARKLPSDAGELFEVRGSLCGGFEVSIVVGNGAIAGGRVFDVSNDSGVRTVLELEDGSITYKESRWEIRSTKTRALRRFARDVLETVREDPDLVIPTDTLDLSATAAVEIRKIRELAG